MTSVSSDVAPRTVLAIDPGTVKCGVAIVELISQPSPNPAKPRALHRDVVETARVVARVLQLLSTYSTVERVLIGNATSGKTLFRALSDSLPPRYTAELVEEAFTSQRARARFHIENPPRGLRRLIPPGLRTPPRPYDDYVAQIIAEDYLLAASPETTTTPHQ